VGCNSRLDSLQAAILLQKLPLVEEKNSRRVAIAEYYSTHLAEDTWITLPKMSENKRSVFHQYTIQVHHGKRDELLSYLENRGIPTRIYYPIPVHQQKGIQNKIRVEGELIVTDKLTSSILSLPIHPLLENDQLSYIVKAIQTFKGGTT
jgi:dTDP-4-amino-4,6-dideoxygalactose transaminase